MLTSFYLLGSQLFPVYLRRQTVSSRDLVCFPVLLQLYRPAMPVCSIQVFGQFFLEILWVYRQVRKPHFISVISTKFSPG